MIGHSRCEQRKIKRRLAPYLLPLRMLCRCSEVAQYHLRHWEIVWMPHRHLGYHQMIAIPECFDVEGLLLTFPRLEAFCIPFCPIFGKKMRMSVVNQVKKMTLAKASFATLRFCTMSRASHFHNNFLARPRQGVYRRESADCGCTAECVNIVSLMTGVSTDLLVTCCSC